MPISFKPIVPKGKLNLLDPEKLKKALRNYGVEVQDKMQDYPNASPGSSYTRTGAYGQRWSVEVLWDRFKVITSNAIYYGGFVGGYKGRGKKGERQTKLMAARGWHSITDVAKKMWDKHLPNIRKVFKEAGWK